MKLSLFHLITQVGKLYLHLGNNSKYLSIKALAKILIFIEFKKKISPLNINKLNITRHSMIKNKALGHHYNILKNNFICKVFYPQNIVYFKFNNLSYQFFLQVSEILRQVVLAFSTCTQLVCTEYKTSISTYLVHVLNLTCTSNKHVFVLIT